jgi:hypothetical protein
MANGLREQLSLLVRSRYPLIYLVSAEEERVERVLRELAKELKLWLWSMTEGMVAAQREHLSPPESAPLAYGAVTERGTSTQQPIGALDHILATAERSRARPAGARTDRPHRLRAHRGAGVAHLLQGHGR